MIHRACRTDIAQQQDAARRNAPRCAVDAVTDQNGDWNGSARLDPKARRLKPEVMRLDGFRKADHGQKRINDAHEGLSSGQEYGSYRLGQGEQARYFNGLPMLKIGTGRSDLGTSQGQPIRQMCLTAIVCMIIATEPALAHDGTSMKQGFLSGVMHPVSGLDHLLAMVAVGLWGAALGRPLIVALPVIFPVVMAAGGLLGIAGVPMPPVEIGIALSVIVLGAAVASAYKAPVWLACSLVGLFGLFHGYAHGQELPAASDPTAYGLGFILATGSLHVAGISIGLLDRHPMGRSAIRVIGIGIAAAGLYFLYGALTK